MSKLGIYLRKPPRRLQVFRLERRRIRVKERKEEKKKVGGRVGERERKLRKGMEETPEKEKGENEEGEKKCLTHPLMLEYLATLERRRIEKDALRASAISAQQAIEKAATSLIQRVWRLATSRKKEREEKAEEQKKVPFSARITGKPDKGEDALRCRSALPPENSVAPTVPRQPTRSAAER